MNDSLPLAELPGGLLIIWPSASAAAVATAAVVPVAGRFRWHIKCVDTKAQRPKLGILQNKKTTKNNNGGQ